MTFQIENKERMIQASKNRVSAFSTPPKAVNPALTLLPLTGAALATATIMYPVDVCRALTMANAGNADFSIGNHYSKVGLAGFVGKGIIRMPCTLAERQVRRFATNVPSLPAAREWTESHGCNFAKLHRFDG